MALSDKDILHQKEKGNIIIEPFDPSQLATSSYDVKLGEHYFREHRQNFDIYNIWSEGETKKVWGEPLRAQPAHNLLPSDFTFDGIHPDDLVILLAPGETILGHTQEFIGGRKVVTSKMQARSSIGRNFIEVCKCAGWGDVGFFNRWTMEITNNSRCYSIPLVVGRRVAQIIFFYTGPILEDDYAKEGKYQTSNNLAELQRSWNPSMMLPRLYKDREIRRESEPVT